MAATPFKGTLITKLPDGSRGPSYRFSASDVAVALVTFDDLGAATAVTVPMGGLFLDDILISASGVDTKALQVRKGVADTDKILRDAPLVETLAIESVSRLQGLKGAFLEPGAQYGFKQLA